MILSAVRKSVAQARDPSFRRVVWLGLALAVALLFAMYALFLALIQAFTPDSLTLPLMGEVRGLGTLLSIGSIVFMLGLSVFLMVPVASAFTGLFLDDVADAVERKHYPQLPPAQRPTLWVSLTDSLQYFGLLLGLNLVGLVGFVVSGGVGLVLLWLINGFLLAREYFTLVALRRIGPDAAQAMRRKYRLRLWAAGLVMALPLSVPILNLFVPVLGAAVFTHLYHALSQRR